jgi:hypothetical protein
VPRDKREQLKIAVGESNRGRAPTTSLLHS